MAIMTSPGQMANDIAKFIYKNQRNVINTLVKAGKLTAEQADKEFARRVAEELLKYGMKIPGWISKII